MKTQLFCSLFVILILLCGIDFSKGDLDIKKVEEGSCEGIEDDLSRDVATKFFYSESTWYISYASQHCFLAYAEALLGRPVKDQKELSKICLKLTVHTLNSTSFFVSTSGYNRTISQICTPVVDEKQQMQEKCSVIKGSPGTKTLVFEQDYRDFVILTDNKTYGVIVLCINGIRTYKVMSTIPEIDKNVYSKIKEKMSALGFNTTMMQTFPCK